MPPEPRSAIAISGYANGRPLGSEGTGRWPVWATRPRDGLPGEMYSSTPSMPSDIVRFARTLSRDQFVERFPGFYLYVSSDPRDMPAGSFQTAVTGRPKDRSAGVGPVAVQVIAIVKAPGNPYPDRISVGRTGNCDIVLRDPSVSKLHAHFRWNERGQLLVVDARSSNGTVLNGVVLLPGVPEMLESGDVVAFGTVRATLLDGSGVYEALQRAWPD